MPRFEAELKATGRTATYVEVPLDVPGVFGSGRPPVRGTVNGHPFRTTVTRRGGIWYFVVNREVREGAGVRAGDTVVVEMERDHEPRVVEVPRDLASALAGAPDARGGFERLSYTHRKEYVEWIEEAKRPETRRRRIEQAVERLEQGLPQR